MELSLFTIESTSLYIRTVIPRISVATVFGVFGRPVCTRLCESPYGTFDSIILLSGVSDPLRLAVHT